MSIRDTISGKQWKVGSHWNRKRINDEGTGIFWSADKQMWEVKVVRHGGYYQDVSEAVNVLQNLMGVNLHDLLIKAGASLHDQVQEPMGAIEGEMKDD